ncbi:small multi-drug export protein [Metabacillus idriensis]|uniref:small multi-drug export protein n=1 Tax=Metabacillus idriensis TaxID=324768 RepID=UPI00163AA207|nr:small multi-drug export protein [Metabacillus idriensis]QNG61584.1 small multi-drug export protein [Bacillus sp. PAMC26568]
METFIAYAVVFIMAAIPLFEVYGVIPIGILAGLSPIAVTITAFLGNAFTVVLLILLIEKVKIWLQKRKMKKQDPIVINEEAATLEENETKRSKRAKKLWNRFGLPGLTIIGPLLVGSHLAAFLSMGFGSKRTAVTGWMLASLLIWSAAAGIGTWLGADFLTAEGQYEGFLKDFLEK